MKPQPDLVLVTGPMVGASSWGPTAARLRASDRWRVHVPDILAARGALPPWRDLAAAYAALLSLEGPPVLVGHSLATVVIVDLAARVGARGLIMVDGEIPPASGPVPPGRESFRAYVAALADDAGQLPRWSDWWRDYPRRSLTGIDGLALDGEAFAAFEQDQPRVAASWFNDTIDLTPWVDTPTGYIQTSGFYDHAAEEAKARGWPLLRLRGTHLHPALQPDDTARAIAAIAGELVDRNGRVSGLLA